jgi:hypothetical protein
MADNDDHFRIIGSGESNWRVEMAIAGEITNDGVIESPADTWAEVHKGDFISCVNWVNNIIQLG